MLLLYKATSQVIVNPQLPQQGVLLKSQLWNLSIIKTGNTNISIVIEMTFTDIANGQRVFIGTSKTLLLNQQVTQIQQTDVTPVSYNILNNSYNVDNSQDGFLPVGQFEVCYAILELTTEGTEKIAESCDGVEIEPISPPLLVFPENETISDLTRPFFTWLPPLPISAFSNLTYDISVVELSALQTPADAIDQNLPLYSESNLSNNFCAYPASLPELDTSKTYAWQISAHSTNNAISKSEVWAFRIRMYALDTALVKIDGFFSPMRRIDDASYITTTGKLRIEYLHELNDSLVYFNYFDLSNNHRDPVFTSPLELSVDVGKNFKLLSFDNFTGIIDKHFYLLAITNSKGEKRYLKFQYRDTNSN
jgi:hypothetical protein